MQRDNVAVIERHRYLEVLHEFTMRQASMKSVDDICWNIAKTAIGELGFVDCVVYLMNEAHSELIQRAAHGNKNPGEREILDPIVIPVGEGIVAPLLRQAFSSELRTRVTTSVTYSTTPFDAQNSLFLSCERV
jgi:hypothetical protein